MPVSVLEARRQGGIRLFLQRWEEFKVLAIDVFAAKMHLVGSIYVSFSGGYSRIGTTGFSLTLNSDYQTFTSL